MATNAQTPSSIHRHDMPASRASSQLLWPTADNRHAAGRPGSWLHPSTRRQAGTTLILCFAGCAAGLVRHVTHVRCCVRMCHSNSRDHHVAGVEYGDEVSATPGQWCARHRAHRATVPQLRLRSGCVLDNTPPAPARHCAAQTRSRPLSLWGELADAMARRQLRVRVQQALPDHGVLRICERSNQQRTHGASHAAVLQLALGAGCLDLLGQQPA